MQVYYASIILTATHVLYMHPGVWADSMGKYVYKTEIYDSLCL